MATVLSDSLSNPTLLRNMLKILPKTVQDQATAAGVTQLKQVFHEEAMVRSLFTIILSSTIFGPFSDKKNF